jgi:hypothetical protein
MKVKMFKNCKQLHYSTHFYKMMILQMPKIKG